MDVIDSNLLEIVSVCEVKESLMLHKKALVLTLIQGGMILTIQLLYFRAYIGKVLVKDSL